MNTMFDTLLQLPLFQGLAQDDFTSILEKVKLHFTKHESGDVIVKANSVCDSLLFVLKGEIGMCVTPPSAPYSVIEFLQAPYLIEPYSLFGMSTNYVGEYVARTDVHTVEVAKRFVLDVLFDYEIFRLNYLNILSNRAQVLARRTCMQTEKQLEKRIAFFLLNLMDRPLGEKYIKIKMMDLAQMMNETRASVSKALNNMQEVGLLELHRGEIMIPEAEKLL